MTKGGDGGGGGGGGEAGEGLECVAGGAVDLRGSDQCSAGQGQGAGKGQGQGSALSDAGMDRMVDCRTGGRRRRFRGQSRWLLATGARTYITAGRFGGG